MFFSAPISALTIRALVARIAMRKKMQEYAKKRVRELGLSGPAQIRINKAGCLDRCEQGPVVVVYPQGVWYSYIDEADIDEIIDSHLVGGKIVERLLIPQENSLVT